MKNIPRQQNIPPMPKVKPPLGVMPRRLHEETRREELRGAIIRYAEAGRPINAEWTEEYNELVKKRDNDDHGIVFTPLKP